MHKGMCISTYASSHAYIYVCVYFIVFISLPKCPYAIMQIRWGLEQHEPSLNPMTLSTGEKNNK